ncbi:MAG: formylglycine-generating enzyme family protein [Verrucomicrobia bacterium]|nr:formylglycine-generating enzyme family protein [Verrucomicrobiota bacterium]MBU1909367.1 formylglycine-generating enzyme family protein [Verrucomicrobiota bacterium]
MQTGRNVEKTERRSWGVAAGTVVVLLLWLCGAGQALANSLVVTNLTLVNNDPVGMTVDLQFDVSWSNSWRASWDDGVTITNWDAAWVFFKVRPGGVGAAWYHARLTPTGHTAQPGISVDVGQSGTNVVGVFIYRSEEGEGSLVCTNVRVRWNYGAHGLVRATNGVDVSVQAVEMVYIPQGSFYVGDGAVLSIYGQFEAGTNGAPFLVTNEAYQITLGGGGADSLGNNNAASMQTADDFNDTTSKLLPAAFPKGHAAFYCMKYEITQHQYVDFLNRLTAVQAPSYLPRVPGSWATSSWPNYAGPARDRAADCLDWPRVSAYLDWAGLRPMTELEFEKACRGPKTAVPYEYAWGDVEIVAQTGHSGTYGSGTETATPANANCNVGAAVGVVRAGIYAATSSTRRQAGAGYYGVMELSGNLLEQTISTGIATLRSFTGTHGDGDIAIAPAGWPATCGHRGGCYNTVFPYSSTTLEARTSDRGMVNKQYSRYYTWNEFETCGGRGVRTAP